MMRFADHLNSTDRKRKRADEPNANCSSPPRWIVALKRHLIEEEECPPISLCDVTRILVSTGFIQANDVCRLAQTCSNLRKMTNQNGIWSSLCHQEFPGGTSHIPQNCIEEKGYKWLYLEWKRSLHDRHAKSLDELPLLPPPRLSADQLFLYAHVSVNHRPINNAPIVLTGIDLSPLLGTGRISYQLPTPLILWSNSRDAASCKVNASTLTDDSHVNDIRIQMHLFSSCDSAMCCVFDEISTGSSRRTYDDDLPQKSRKAQQDFFLDFGPCCSSYSCCSLPLRKASTSATVESRFGSSIVFVVGSNLRLTETDVTEQFVMTAIDITIQKYDGSNSTIAFDVFNSTELKENGGVTLLHYLSELQFVKS